MRNSFKIDSVENVTKLYNTTDDSSKLSNNTIKSDSLVYEIRYTISYDDMIFHDDLSQECIRRTKKCVARVELQYSCGHYLTCIRCIAYINPETNKYRYLLRHEYRYHKEEIKVIPRFVKAITKVSPSIDVHGWM